MISVCIPVGPYNSNKQWLDEAIASIRDQTLQPDKVIIIQDGADRNKIVDATFDNGVGLHFQCWVAPWRLGVAHAFNFGVMLAPTECVFMLGSDDTLEPTCLEKCVASYEQHGKRDAYYAVPVKYMDTGEIQTAPCNAAMVTKGFWRKTGGFPIQAAMGMPDSMLLSICLKYWLPVYFVGEGRTPLYNYRNHPDSWTRTHGEWHELASQARNLVTEQWQPPEWGDKY